MIELSGPMDLGRVILFTRSSGLALVAYAPHSQSVDGVAYRLIWDGAEAAAFYKQHSAFLHVGKRVHVTGRHPRAVTDRGEVCISLDVTGIKFSAPNTSGVTWASHEVGA